MRTQIFRRSSRPLPGFEDKAFIQSVSCLPDPRQQSKVLYPLDDILFLCLCGFVCGVQGFHDLEEFGQEKLTWLRRFLPFHCGIPSHDTLGRVVGALDPKQLDSWLAYWAQSVQQHMQGIVAIDGKSVRGSRNKAASKRPQHLLNAFACAHRVVLAVQPVADKSNEITGIPHLLKKLVLKGSTVTIDAMGCQKEIAALIQEKKGDYVLALKSNHATLHELVKDEWTQAEKEGFSSKVYACHEEVDKGHGRVETRRCVCTQSIGWLGKEILQQWPGLRTLVMVHSTCWRKGKQQEQRRFFLSSLSAEPERLLQAVRSHWHIENGLHYILDVAFNEDACRAQERRAVRNMSFLRKVALNLLQQVRKKRPKDGIKSLQRRASWNNGVLESILMQPLQKQGG